MTHDYAPDQAYPFRPGGTNSIIPGNKRTERRQKRLDMLCHAYSRLLEDCTAILRPYYRQPVYWINRYWAGLNIAQLLYEERLPGAPDFFAWFCDSDTIAREREGAWD